MGCFSTTSQGSTSVTADFLKQHGVCAHTGLFNFLDMMENVSVALEVHLSVVRLNHFSRHYKKHQIATPNIQKSNPKYVALIIMYITLSCSLYICK